MQRWILLLTIVLTLGVMGPTQGVGQNHDRARDAVRSGEIRPLGDILQSARGAYAGEVLDVELLQRGPPSNWLYEVRMLTPQGHVIAVIVDAPSARVVEARGRGAEAARRR